MLNEAFFSEKNPAKMCQTNDLQHQEMLKFYVALSFTTFAYHKIPFYASFPLFSNGRERFWRQRHDFQEKITEETLLDLNVSHKGDKISFDFTSPVNLSDFLVMSHYMISMLWSDPMSVGMTF